MSYFPATHPSTGLRLRLQLPGDKSFRLPVGAPERDRAMIEAQVDRRIEHEPVLANTRDELIDMVLHFTIKANRPGVAAAALLWALDERGSAIMATLYATVHQRLAPGSVADELAIISAKAQEAHVDLQFSIEEREPPAGKALRVQGLTNLPKPPTQIKRELPADEDDDDQDGADDLPLAGRVVQDRVQYWLPRPDLSVTVALTLATPNLVAAEHVLPAIDTIAETLAVEAAPT